MAQAYQASDINCPFVAGFFFFCRNLLKRIPQVSLEDLMRVGHKYIAPLFDPAQSSCAICCHPSKVEEIREEFNRWV